MITVTIRNTETGREETLSGEDAVVIVEGRGEADVYSTKGESACLEVLNETVDVIRQRSSLH